MLSIVPTLVALASLLNDVPAVQFHATILLPFPFGDEAVPNEKPSLLKDVKVCALVFYDAELSIYTLFVAPLTESNS